MGFRGDIFACFDALWQGVDPGGFENGDRWQAAGRVPDAAGVEPRFWEAVHLQANGGRRWKWRNTVDFHAYVLDDSQVTASEEPFWLGLQPFGGVTRLWVSTAKVSRARPAHRMDRHPGDLPPERSTLLGLRLTLGDDGTYFDVARP